jgi:hypothetical protein
MDLRDCGNRSAADCRLGVHDGSINDAGAREVDPRRRLNHRLRAAFIAGAEEDSRRRLGRGLTREELERVLRRYPGDV